jgi:hypothetical protein
MRRVFPVKVKTEDTDNAGALKAVIKAATEPLFNDTPTHVMDIWKVSADDDVDLSEH